jgi:hypothetical protein
VLQKEIPMKRTILSIVAASALFIGVASAQTTTTTTTTWTNDQGMAITKYSTTQKYTSYMDPAMKPTVGMELPNTVTIYPLPSTVTVETPDRYSYGMVNEHPVIVERTTRKIVHTFPN